MEKKYTEKDFDKETLDGYSDKYTDEGLDLQADPLMRYIVEQYGLLKEDDNPRLIGVEFKNI